MRTPKTIITIAGTPVKLNIAVLVNLTGLWVLLIWLIGYWHPERALWQNFVIAFFAMLTLLIADIGHAIAHIFSARYAQAPMDEVIISAGMPRTIYYNNNVEPSKHRLRAFGGPIFSLIGLLISLGLFYFAHQPSILRELAGWSSIGHAFILFGCLVPLPIVDGGSILKWTLVERGQEESKADTIIRIIDIVLGAAACIAGLILLVLKMWLIGLASLLVSAIALAAAMGKIR